MVLSRKVWSPPRPAKTLRRAQIRPSAFLRQYRHHAKNRATCPWYSRGYLAIRLVAWLLVQHAALDFGPILPFVNGLTAPWQRTYSSSRQVFRPLLPTASATGRMVAPAKKSRIGPTKWPKVRLGSA